MSKLAKGESIPLNYSPQASHRIFAGLGWDPVGNPGVIGKLRSAISGQKNYHDLDLACYIYDAHGAYISHVSTERGREKDQTGKIYHSGDNVEGLGEGDDEQISVELKDLDPVIGNIIFKASIKSGHRFCDVSEPEIHVSDGYTGRSLLHQNLKELPRNKQNSFIFARLFKLPDGPWMLENISEFRRQAPAQDWPEILRHFTRI